MAEVINPASAGYVRCKVFAAVLSEQACAARHHASKRAEADPALSSCASCPIGKTNLRRHGRPVRRRRPRRRGSPWEV